MAKVSKSDVEHLADLANIALESQDVAKIQPQLEAILNYVAKLQATDTSNLEITSQVTALKDVWRQDVVRPSKLSRDELLANAPATKDGYIKVKRVL